MDIVLLTEVSKSCPDLASNHPLRASLPARGSLPDRLKTDMYGALSGYRCREADSLVGTPNTPPPSPGAISTEENLVLISITMSEPENGVLPRIRHKTIGVDFNCLDLIVSVESWMVVLDFLGIGSPGPEAPPPADQQPNRSRDQASLAVAEEQLPVHSEIDIEINSLTLVLTQPEREIARANVSNATMHLVRADGTSRISGSLGSMSLLDLTVHGRFYRERFLTSGRKALNFQYASYANSAALAQDAQLSLQMSAVHYVHTQRFVAELQAFFAHFSRLRAIMANLRAGGAFVDPSDKRSVRLLLELHAGAPVILLPVSSRSEEMILLDLGELSARNSFVPSAERSECLLDIMSLELVNMDVHAARKLSSSDAVRPDEDESYLSIGGFVVKKTGPSLLTEKCQLRLRVERNLDSYLSRFIPDLSVHGTLSTMDCALDPSQYMLIRGLLSYNIGENLDDLRALVRDTEEYAIPKADADGKVWTSTYVCLELVNVTLKLHPRHGLPALACFNFIKSRLILDALSDGSQDIDLVSTEILVTDTRFQDEPINRRSNVFTSILQPLRESTGSADHVQAEVHHRKRKGSSATTVLLHSMRLTAILDWWEAIRDFLVLNAPEPEPVQRVWAAPAPASPEADGTANFALPFELKLNITDSELVLVENTSIWDSNAVILKCTTVLNYKSKPQNGEKPMSCNLSHCELFSCILGLGRLSLFFFFVYFDMYLTSHPVFLAEYTKRRTKRQQKTRVTNTFVMPSRERRDASVAEWKEAGANIATKITLAKQRRKRPCR
jgi:vacuolar protein sorting-associated protein 13D